MIKRDLYLNKMIQSRDKDYIKLLVGVRRSGKSTLLELMKEYLLSDGIKDEQIISINFEMTKYDYLKDGKELHKFIENKIIPDKRIYLFLDEVQEINEWARVVNSLRVSYNVDIYATGSNARMFIGEHLTYIAGRYLTINVFPLSYDELILFLNEQKHYKEHYDTFLESSFPSVVLEEHNKRLLQDDIFKSIFERDIILRGGVTREREFYAIARYVLEHIGQPISINKIYNYMKSNKINISYDSVSNYVSLMVKSYFLYECLRYDVKGKEELRTLSKYYAVDFGIRNVLLPNKDSNRGRVLENFIYLELIKHGYRVYSGRVGKDYKIDFVAKKGNEVIYIQVTETMLDERVREREERPFHSLNDNYERIIVSLDSLDYTTNMYNHMNLFDFILFLGERKNK